LSGAYFLTGANNNRYASGSHTFDHVVFSRLTTLNLSGTNFSETLSKSGGTYYTGDNTFAYDSFPNLKNINFNNSKFTFAKANSPLNRYGEIHTCYQTFTHAHFGQLNTLDISGAQFASGNMTENGSIYTADQTFAFATFDTTHANFNATYADQYMLKGTGNDVTISTGFHTFESTIFSQLPQFNLDDVQFATANMATVGSSVPDGKSSNVNTGDNTF
jgi:hypothetical protein